MQILASGGSIDNAQCGQRAERFSWSITYGFLSSSSSFFTGAGFGLGLTPVGFPAAGLAAGLGSGFAPGGALTVKMVWHFLHLSFLPTRSDGTLRLLSHSGQLISMSAMLTLLPRLGGIRPPAAHRTMKTRRDDVRYDMTGTSTNASTFSKRAHPSAPPGVTGDVQRAR